MKPAKLGRCSEECIQDELILWNSLIIISTNKEQKLGNKKGSEDTQIIWYK